MKKREVSVVPSGVTNSAIGINAYVFGDVGYPQGSYWNPRQIVRLVVAITKIHVYICLTNEY